MLTCVRAELSATPQAAAMLGQMSCTRYSPNDWRNLCRFGAMSEQLRNCGGFDGTNFSPVDFSKQKVILAHRAKRAIHTCTIQSSCLTMNPFRHTESENRYFKIGFPKGVGFSNSDGQRETTRTCRSAKPTFQGPNSNANPVNLVAHLAQHFT